MRYQNVSKKLSKLCYYNTDRQYDLHNECGLSFFELFSMNIILTNAYEKHGSKLIKPFGHLFVMLCFKLSTDIHFGD